MIRKCWIWFWECFSATIRDMAVHTIMLPDRMRGREPRSVIWDDEKGTVTGEHYEVPWMQEILAKPTPVDFSNDEMEIHLLDPAHDPRDFLWLLLRAYWPILDEPLRQTLPPVFRDVELREGVPYPPWIITNEDGTTTTLVLGRDYLP